MRNISENIVCCFKSHDYPKRSIVKSLFGIFTCPLLKLTMVVIDNGGNDNDGGENDSDDGTDDYDSVVDNNVND